MRTSLIALGTALLVAVSPGASAQEVSASASAPPGVLYNDCVDHLADYSVQVNPGDTSWFLSLQVVGPDGNAATAAYRQAGDPTTGTVPLSFCGSSTVPGTFTLTGRLLHDVGSSTPVPATTFTLRNPMTNTTAEASETRPRKGQVVTIKVTSRDEMPGGYVRKDDGTVVLQQKTAQGWSKVKGSKTATNDKGKAKLKVRYPGGKVKLRAVTKGSADWETSHSRRIVLR